MTETVNHPAHYNAHPSGVEAIDIVEHLSFNLGNAVKYLWRRDHKGRDNEDTRKALWYLDRELERLHAVTSIEPLTPAVYRLIARVRDTSSEGPLYRILNMLSRTRGHLDLYEMIHVVEFAIATVREELRCGR